MYAKVVRRKHVSARRLVYAEPLGVVFGEVVPHAVQLAQARLIGQAGGYEGKCAHARRGA